MKYITLFILVLFTGVLYQCRVPEKVAEPVVYKDKLQAENGTPCAISIVNGKSFNHPSYVIWQEDMMGNYQRTIFITKSYASGIFGHQMVGDSIWLKTPGESYQPAALPYWSHKKKGMTDESLIPTPENPFMDAYTGATPKGNLLFETVLDGSRPYRLLLEVNQPWDWNNFWTNNKYPDSEAYKHSAQPSVIYAVTIDREGDRFYMNPIGHGDPTGESGKLFTRLNTITSATAIFDSIEITFNNK